jgi:23S rRNA pseudouridine2605 synthase
MPETKEKQRLAKAIARAGLCSRREAETWIAAGRVAVNGEVAASPALDVGPEDRVTVDGQPLPEPDRPRLFRFHKPPGVVVTARDEKGRRTIYDVLPAGLPRLQPVGRLDLATEGLLLLTNDGELKRKLELPSQGWQRHYRARVFGEIDEARLAALEKGVTIDGFSYGPIAASLERRTGRNAWLVIVLTEGKNREIRKVLEHLGLQVNRLIRTAYGPLQLGNLARGAVSEVARGQLRDQLGVGEPIRDRSGFAKAKPRPKKPLHKARRRKRSEDADRRR